MFKAFITTMSGARYSMWQIIVLFLFSYSYHDDDRKSDGNVLVINNVMKHILYIYN